ncbi:MAG: NmrA/HSCARG family protein [Chitinophagaceae bacterium]|nr:NmrA/HSCARG family protein [Chitinophagaceae bacterium]
MFETSINKSIFVTGATGNQGGAVAKNLLLNGFKIKCLTRNPNADRAQKLKNLDAEIILGDLNKPGTFEKHLENVDGVFSVQTFENGVKKEIEQGITLANISKEAGVRHFLYSSIGGADFHTGIPHFESKLIIEEHIKKIGLPYTIIRPVGLYENFLLPQVKSRLLKGKLMSPLHKRAIQQYVASDDIGKLAVKIFLDPVKYLNSTITVASEELDLDQTAAIFSKALNMEIKYQHLPWLITRLAMGKELYKMFRWINTNNAVFMKELNNYKMQNPSMQNLEQWIQLNFKK